MGQQPGNGAGFKEICAILEVTVKALPVVFQIEKQIKNRTAAWQFERLERQIGQLAR